MWRPTAQTVRTCAMHLRTPSPTANAPAATVPRSVTPILVVELAPTRPPAQLYSLSHSPGVIVLSPRSHAVLRSHRRTPALTCVHSHRRLLHSGRAPRGWLPQGRAAAWPVLSPATRAGVCARGARPALAASASRHETQTLPPLSFCRQRSSSPPPRHGVQPRRVWCDM